MTPLQHARAATHAALVQAVTGKDVMRIEMPWPPKELLPNKRLHWAAKAKAAKAHKWLCALAIHQWKQDTGMSLAGRVKYRLTFSPPDKRRRDVDGCISSIKYLIDALSEAAHVDDSKFEITFPRTFSEPVKGGCIRVQVL